MRVLHLSPHPDDELLGSPAVLIALADAGHEVVNLAVSLGRPADHARREAEVKEACGRAGFRLRICSPSYALARDDDLDAAEARLTDELLSVGRDGQYELLVAPSPHDGHHGHELVGRAACAGAAGLSLPLWMWGLWSDLPVPTILHEFDRPVLARIMDALAAYQGELGRNDYRRLVSGRAQAMAVLGPERVFGFGAGGSSASYAEALCELVPSRGSMLLGSPRVLDPHAPLLSPGRADMTSWLQATSLRDQIGR